MILGKEKSQKVAHEVLNAHEKEKIFLLEIIYDKFFFNFSLYFYYYRDKIVDVVCDIKIQILKEFLNQVVFYYLKILNFFNKILKYSYIKYFNILKPSEKALTFFIIKSFSFLQGTVSYLNLNFFVLVEFQYISYNHLLKDPSQQIYLFYQTHRCKEYQKY